MNVPLNILLVEDDNVDAERIERVLQRVPVACEIHRVEDGLRAKERIQSGGAEGLPDVILLDLRMPRMNGYEFLDWANAEAIVPKVPIIVLTTSTDRAEEKESISRGATGVIQKSALKVGQHDIGEFLKRLSETPKTESSVHTMKCLVVEDDVVYKEKVERLLGNRFSLRFASSASDAVELIDSEDFDAALVDYKLPGENGLGLLDALVERDIPSVMITNKGSEEIAVSAMRAGAADYVIKEASSLEYIAKTLERAVERVRQREEKLRADREKDQIIADLRQALKRIEVLEGLLPICSYCKKVRDDEGYWKTVETFMSKEMGVSLTHGVCPECYQEQVRILEDS